MRLEDEIKMKKFNNEFEKGLVNILYTYNWVDSHMKDFFKPFDLTPQQYNILRILRGQYPNPSTINLLKDRMLDKMSDASRIVERLRLKNLLERKVCPSDRRSVDILISQAGLDLLTRIDPELMSHHQKLLGNLSQQEVESLNNLLDKLRG
jgi:DNA-binding MarR family transcriptional regulator